MNLTNEKLEKAVADLVEQKNLMVDELTKEQVAMAIIQAIMAGDFKRLVAQYSGAQQVIYLPYMGIEELRSEVSRLKALLVAHGIDPRSMPENTDCSIDRLLQ